MVWASGTLGAVPRHAAGTVRSSQLAEPKIVALQTDDTVSDLVATAAESGFSRFPIIDGDLDETVGIVHVKQVFEIPRADRARTLLTTVAQPSLEKGRHAGNLLHNPPRSGLPVIDILPTELVRGRTAGAPG